MSNKKKIVITVLGLLALIGLQVVAEFAVPHEMIMPAAVLFVFVYQLYVHMIKIYLFK